MSEFITHKGSCHCGAIQFEVDAPSQLHAHACNCFNLLYERWRSDYCSGFAVSVALRDGCDDHYIPLILAVPNIPFVSTAALNPFIRRALIRMVYSVNLRCVERTHIESIEVDIFDGQNWEQNAASLAHLSREE